MKAVIFDLEGSLINSEQLNFEVLRETLSGYGYSLEREEYKEIFMGRKLKESLNRYLGKEHKNSSRIAKECKVLKKEIFSTGIRKNIVLREGTRDCIKRLYRDFSLGLCSQMKKELASAMVREFNLGFYFNEITFGDEFRELKPSAEGFLLTAQKLRMSPHNCIVLVSSENGVLAGTAAGMKTIAVPNDFTRQQNLSKADIVLKGFGSIDATLVGRL